MAVHTPISNKLRLFGTHKADYAELAIGRIDLNPNGLFTRKKCVYLVLNHHRPIQDVNGVWSLLHNLEPAGWKHINKTSHYHYAFQSISFLPSTRVRLELTAPQLASVGLPADTFVHYLASADLPLADLMRMHTTSSLKFLAWATEAAQGNAGLPLADQGPYHPNGVDAWRVVPLDVNQSMRLAGPGRFTIMARAEFETIPGHRDGAAQKLVYYLTTRLPFELDPTVPPNVQFIWRTEDMAAMHDEMELFQHNAIERREIYRQYVSRDGKVAIGLIKDVTPATFATHRLEWILCLIDRWAVGMTSPWLCGTHC